MREVVLSSKFKRAFRKFVRRNPNLQSQIEETLVQMESDVFAVNLATHKLEGKLAGLRACSCGYDCRIVFSIENEEETNRELIVLIDIGTHDEVY
jgi:mRNA interferase YafQ